MLGRKLLLSKSSAYRAWLSVRNVSDSAAQQQIAEQSRRQRFRWGGRTLTVVVVATTSAGAITIVSIQTRRERAHEIQKLPLAEMVWNNTTILRQRSVTSNLIEMVQRAGLMGRQSSVKHELHEIRKWHHEHHFKGGLVLRDLSQPLYDSERDDVQSESDDQDANHDKSQDSTWSVAEIMQDPARLARRECYYVYYEVKSNGAVQQQIFCRGERRCG